MIAKSRSQPGLPPTSYYAPNYRVEVDGRELDPAAKGDVLDVKVVLDIENIAGFEISLNNWDDQSLSFKYSDTRRLDLGRRVHIQMGYADRLVSLVRGMITSMSPRFPESGSPIINIAGHDLLYCLKDRKPTEGDKRQFQNMFDWQIAQEIAQRNGLESVVTQEGPLHDLVVQKNQDDAIFLMERAKRIDFDVFVQTDPDTGRDRLHFVKPTDGRDASPIRSYEFEWGKNLIEFNPELTLSGQVSTVRVRGWNPRTKEPIEASASVADLPGGASEGANGPAVVSRSIGSGRGREEAVVDSPVTSEEEAKALAISLLREKAYEFITGSGRVIGLPDLQPGTNVLLKGLGRRFSGRYYVKKVDHSLGANGYVTQFDVRKFADGGTQ